jgi:hypothetical protein
VADDIDEQLDRLIEDFNRLLRKPTATGVVRDSADQLKTFGLTMAEAMAWLEQEPSFKRDVTKSYQNQESLRKMECLSLPSV